VPQVAEQVVQAPTLSPDLALPELGGIAYLEVVTGGAEPDAALPMIVALHGNGAFPRLMEYALISDLGTDEYPAVPFDRAARCIFLRGTEPIEDAAPGHARWFSITAREALAKPAQLEALSLQISERSDQVAAMITELARVRPTIGKPIITGHSQGGILTYGLAIRHPELFAAAFPVSGWLPEPMWPTQHADASARGLSIVALHGALDKVVPFDVSTTSVERLRLLDYAIELRPFPDVGHELSPMLAKLRELLGAQ
jgi:phospholipase/carboxylesterase